MATTTIKKTDELAAPLDLLLTGSALGMAERMMPNTAWSRFALSLARQPRTVASRAKGFGKELVSVAGGRSDLTPAKGDKRFADPAWRGNPLLRRTVQAYLATNDTVNQLFSDAELDWRDAQRIRFVLNLLTEGLAPSNNPLMNPLGWKALLDTGGLSAIRGLRNFVGDMLSAPRVPTMVDPEAFTLGETTAATPGEVIFRTEEFELIQYTPQTDEVYEVPLLMVPPVINKYYIMDVAPGRSMIEYFVSQGIQVFTISWRNPGVDQRHWGFDTYGQAILNALDAVEKVTACDRVHLQGSCSGGILASMTAAHLNAVGEGHRLAGLTLMVTVLDQHKAGLAAAAIDEDAAKVAVALSERKGYLDGKRMSEVFAWLRPTDLVWRYWVNNYVEGKSPAPFDVLYWNADSTRMTATLHRDMVNMAVQNSLVPPGGVSMLGTPVDLNQVATEAYVVAGVADHISPWQACYRSARLLGVKDARFVLSSSGHIASLVNPPGNVKASYRVGDVYESDPEFWAESAEQRTDSWWPDFAAWFGERGGDKKSGPEALGGAGMPPLEPAPGSYVREH